LVLLILPMLGFPLPILFALISVVPAYRSANRLRNYPETVREIVPAQANALLAFLLFALGAGVGFIFG
jgi:hypothetical protein